MRFIGLGLVAASWVGSSTGAKGRNSEPAVVRKLNKEAVYEACAHEIETATSAMFSEGSDPSAAMEFLTAKVEEMKSRLGLSADDMINCQQAMLKRMGLDHDFMKNMPKLDPTHLEEQIKRFETMSEEEITAELERLIEETKEKFMGSTEL